MLPKWEGAEVIYGRALRALEIMGRSGHATPARFNRRGKMVEQGSASEEMRVLVDALNRGDEETIKGLLLQTHIYPWGG